MGDQFFDESAKLFRWKIRRFSEKDQFKFNSQKFSLYGETWKVEIYPKGKTVSDHLSIFLRVNDGAMKHRRWKKMVNSRFILVNQINGDDSMIRGSDAEYDARSVSWGYERFAPINEITDPSEGYMVDDTLIVEVKFESESLFLFATAMISFNKLIEEEIVFANKFVWKITNFPRLTGQQYESSIFEIGGVSWRLTIFPQGVEAYKTHLGFYLCVENSETSPEVWTIKSTHKLDVVNQNDNSGSIITHWEVDLNAVGSRYVFGRKISLRNLHDIAGFIVNDTLILEAVFSHLNVEPLIAMFDSYFTRLQKYIDQESKKSLEESRDTSNLDLHKRLAKYRLTLRNATSTGLTVDQQRTAREFWADFGDISSEFFSFEKVNAELQLQKIMKDHMFSALQWSQKTHISLKTRSDELAKEEDELKKELQGVNSKREELIKEWDILMLKSKQKKRHYETLENELADAEAKKRITEERFSRSS